MLEKSLIAVSLVLLVTFGASAQSVYTPERGSSERKAILDSLRIPVEKELKQKIQFNINEFNVLANWAFVSGDPQDLNGDRPNYRGTVYQKDVETDMFDNNFFALLKKTGKKWKVITHAIGCTDVCYAMWWKTYKAPKAVFPYTE